MKRQRPAHASNANQALQRCDVCAVSVPSQIWHEHCTGKKHLVNAAKNPRPADETVAAKLPQNISDCQSKERQCKVCGVGVPKNIWDEHCTGKKHRVNLAKKGAPPDSPADGHGTIPEQTSAAGHEAGMARDGSTCNVEAVAGRSFGKNKRSVSAPEVPIPVWNRGHQMMLKLGWSGGVLGASGAGIDTPITASTMYRGRLGLGGTLAFPDLPSENQAFLQHCDVCGGPVPKQIWEEHCAGKKHQKNMSKASLAKKCGQNEPLQDATDAGSSSKRTKILVSGADGKGKEVLVQAAQRFCEACKRAVPNKAWEMHCGGKKHAAKVALLNNGSVGC